MISGGDNGRAENIRGSKGSSADVMKGAFTALRAFRAVHLKPNLQSSYLLSESDV